MVIRKRIIGDLWLSGSILFIFLGFVYLTFIGRLYLGWTFLTLGAIYALFGMYAKKVLAKKEKPLKTKKK